MELGPHPCSQPCLCMSVRCRHPDSVPGSARWTVERADSRAQLAGLRDRRPQADAVDPHPRWHRLRVAALGSARRGAGGAGAATLAASPAELVTFAVLALACAMLLVIDLAAFRLPDIIVGPMYSVLLLELSITAATAGDGEWLGRAAMAMLVYFVPAYIAPSGQGLGDVKLSGLLGAFMGWLGWSHTFLGVLAGFALSALVLALVPLLATGATRRSEFPFDPWMMIGAAAGVAWGPAVFPGTA